MAKSVRWLATGLLLIAVAHLGPRAYGEGLGTPARPDELSTNRKSAGSPTPSRIASSPTIEAAPPPAAGPPLSPAHTDQALENQRPTGDPFFTLAELEEIALANNPTLLQAAARVRAARAKCLQVGLYPNPALLYRGEEMGDEDRAGLQGAFFSQEIVTAGKLRHRRAVVAHEIQQAEYARQAQCGRVLNGTCAPPGTTCWWPSAPSS